jgi:DNA-binding LacI/PurR family transcriptional regulator
MTYAKHTIKDVALAAGVSTQTISRVLNNRPDVSNQTRERVLRIIAKLNYSPSILARRLRRENDKSVISFGSNGNGSSFVSAYEVRKTIEGALVNGILSQEKAAWLLQGIEKGFMTDGYLVQLLVVQHENQGEFLCLEQNDMFLFWQCNPQL